ncbi:MAG: hypothetical protein ACRC0L_06240 [Angustibacter sp.]
MQMHRSAGTLTPRIEASSPVPDPLPCLSCGSVGECVARLGRLVSCREWLESRVWGACPVCVGRRVAVGTVLACERCAGVGFVEMAVTHRDVSGQELVIYPVSTDGVEPLDRVVTRCSTGAKEPKPSTVIREPIPGEGRCLHCAQASPCVVPTEADYEADDDLYECWESLELRAWGACPACRGRGTSPAGGACQACHGQGLREILADPSCWDDAIKVNPNQGLARA